ncbi:MAG: hypothetical protein V8S08_10535, partial [Lachnoclostridium sp.]
TTAQMEAAKAELGKPFPQEEELRVKSARLAELNAELNIDERTPVEQLADDAAISAKAERLRTGTAEKYTDAPDARHARKAAGAGKQITKQRRRGITFPCRR